MLLLTFLYKAFGGLVFSLILGKYQGVELLGHVLTEAGLSVVAHTYNCSYSGSGDWEDQALRLV
jgi:hypothetical protein